MGYEPTTWKDGDLVTSAKLNKIEQGIASGSSVVIPTYTLLDVSGKATTTTCNMTFAEITSAISEGKYVVCRFVDPDGVYLFLPVTESSAYYITYSTTIINDGREALTCINVLHNSEDEIELIPLYIPASSSESDSNPGFNPSPT